MKKEKYDSLPFNNKTVVNRNNKLKPMEVRYGVFVLDQYYKNTKLRFEGKTHNMIEQKHELNGKVQSLFGIRCSVKDMFEYMHSNPNQKRNFNNVDEAVDKIIGEAWVKYYENEEIEIRRAFVFKTVKYKYKREYIDILVDAPLIENIILNINAKKDGNTIFIPPWIYGSRYNLTRHQIRLYELYYLWRGKSRTYAVGYDSYIKDFFNVNYKNMGAFKIGALNKAIQDLKERNMLDINIEKVKATGYKSGKYNYIFKFKKLEGEIKYD